MAMKTFNVGDPLGSADVNEYLVNTIYAIKNVSTTRASTTTLTNDPHLSVQVGPNKDYLVLIQGQYQTPSAAGLRVSLAFPSGATLNGALTFGFPLAGLNGIAYDQNLNTIGQNISIPGNAGTGGDCYFTIQGILSTAGTGGGFTLQWCQDTSNGGNTIFLHGSSMLLRRVA